jgi:hypothetical protein
MGCVRPARGLYTGTTQYVGRADPDPQLGWVVPDLSRARNYVLWTDLLGKAQMYTYIH